MLALLAFASLLFGNSYGASLFNFDENVLMLESNGTICKIVGDKYYVNGVVKGQLMEEQKKELREYQKESTKFWNNFNMQMQASLQAHMDQMMNQMVSGIMGPTGIVPTTNAPSPAIITTTTTTTVPPLFDPRELEKIPPLPKFCIS